ncbi:MAG: hypothetical protein KDK99_11625 [Verrucomicrobiales bacterium]|nr:hypothetical protein [Verrucomicrobiales bacterium]
MRMRIWMVVGGLVLSMLGASRGEDSSALRAELERVYHKWRGAIINKDVNAWQGSTSRYRQVQTRNLMVSQRQPYPAAVFQIPMQPPDIVTLRLLEAEAVGPTAHLIYFGKVDVGIEADEVPENLLMLRFIKDPEGWRFDSSRMVNLENAPEIRQKLKERGDADFLNDPEFNPPGTAPAVPPVCPVPDHMAAFRVEAMGYEVVLKINGFDYPPLGGVAVTQLIIGGLRQGENDVTVNIRATEVPEGEERHLLVALMVVNPDPSVKPVVISQFETSDPNPPAVRKMTAWVNNSVLKR